MERIKRYWTLLVPFTMLLFVLGCDEETTVRVDDEEEEETLSYVVSISADKLSLTEGTDDSSEITISLDEKNETGSAISILYDKSGSTESGDDYTELSGKIDIEDGEQSVSFDLMLIDDDQEESDETLDIALSSILADNITLGTNKSISFTITDDDSEVVETATNDISILASKFYHTDAVTVTYDDSWVTITTKVLPDHKSMYYATDNELYEAYDEPDNDDFKKNPGEIEEQNIVFKLPRYPTEATNKESPGLGPMGVAINSVVFFNQEAAGDDDIFEELNTFDQYEGHPAGATYHYHIEPVWLTELKGNDAFMGFLLDGFPVYGTHENGVEIKNDDLNEYHGHFGETADFPEGIYHYHLTVEYPWINGDGYFGEPGTRTN